MRRSSKLPEDPNQRAFEIVRQHTGGEEQPTPQTVSEYLAEIGRKGGLKGGKARAKKLSRKRRSDIARKAAIAKWSKTKKP
jgi:hypothetical protein